MTAQLVRTLALTSLMIALGGPVAAQAPEMKAQPGSGQRITPLPQRVLDPCHGLSPEACAKACGRGLSARSRSRRMVTPPR